MFKNITKKIYETRDSNDRIIFGVKTTLKTPFKTTEEEMVSFFNPYNGARYAFCDKDIVLRLMNDDTRNDTELFVYRTHEKLKEIQLEDLVRVCKKPEPEVSEDFKNVVDKLLSMATSIELVNTIYNDVFISLSFKVSLKTDVFSFKYIVHVDPITYQIDSVSGHSMLFYDAEFIRLSNLIDKNQQFYIYSYVLKNIANIIEDNKKRLLADCTKKILESK